MNFEILAVTVGTRPQACYNTIDFFIQNNPQLKSIVLITSVDNHQLKQIGTEKIADKIKQIFGDKNITFEPNCNLNDVNSSENIYQDIKKYFHNYEGKKVHLNYTAGTKAMSVNIYYKMLEIFKDDFSSSYLDVRTASMNIDSGKIIKYDEKEKSIELIGDLNGYNIELKYPQKNNVNEYYSELFNSPTFNDFKEKNYLKFKEQKSYIDSVITMIDNYREHDDLKDLLNTNLFSYVENKLNKFYSNSTNRKDLKKVFQYIQGKWFDDHIYFILEKRMNDIKNLKVYPSFCAVRHNDSLKKTFEIDGAIVMGSKLICISCTTSDLAPECKLKALEVLYRASQVAGENYQAILICMLNKNDDEIKEFKTDLEKMTGGVEKKLEILTLKNIYNEDQIVEKIKHFVVGKNSNV